MKKIYKKKNWGLIPSACTDLYRLVTADCKIFRKFANIYKLNTVIITH